MTLHPLKTFLLALVMLLPALTAQADHLSVEDELILLFEMEEGYYQARSEAVLDVSVTDESLRELALHPDWRVRSQAAILLGWRQQPELSSAVYEAQSVPGREGRIHRFMAEAFREPAASPAILERMLHAPDADVVKAALAHSLVGLYEGWGEDMIGILGAARTEKLAVAAIAAFRWAEPVSGLAGLRIALERPEAKLRETAASVAAWRADGLELAAELRMALTDSDSRTRAMAARALGYLQDLDGAGALLPILDDPSAEVRLHALRSLDRVAPELAARELATSRLSGEVDERVLRVQNRIRAR